MSNYFVLWNTIAIPSPYNHLQSFRPLPIIQGLSSLPLCPWAGFCLASTNLSKIEWRDSCDASWSEIKSAIQGTEVVPAATSFVCCWVWFWLYLRDMALVYCSRTTLSRSRVQWGPRAERMGIVLFTLPLQHHLPMLKYQDISGISYLSLRLDSHWSSLVSGAKRELISQRCFCFTFPHSQSQLRWC